MSIDLHRSAVKDRTEIEFSRKSKLMVDFRLWLPAWLQHLPIRGRCERATAFEIVLSVGMSLNGSALGNA
jgi:hypothetical protein